MVDKMFTYVLHIAATPQEVWQALTLPEYTKQYWAGLHFQTDWKVDSELSLRTADGTSVVKGKILISDQPDTLSYSWQVDDNEHPAFGIPTRVAFLLTPAGSTTALTLIHEGYEPGTPAYLDISQAWPAVLSGLKTLLETGEPLPIDWDEFLSGEGPRMEVKGT